MQRPNKFFFFVCALIMTIGMASCSTNNRSSPAPASYEVEKKNAADSAKPVSWSTPSGGAYPTLNQNETIWLDVSIKDQKVYVKEGDQTIYTMIASTGLDTSSDTTTPKGTYSVQNERGEWFYSARYQEGAAYWVSWKNHGEFLFHSVPMDQNREVITAAAEKLGKKDSHGCIRLTIPDAKWIYENILVNTKVVIH